MILPLANIQPDLEAAIQGDGRALERLVQVSIPVVLAWCYRLASPGVDPDDAAQQVFVVAFDRLHTLRDPEAFPAWLFGITRRVLFRLREKARPRDVANDDTWSPPTPEASCEEEGFAQDVRRILERLPEEQRVALVLYDAMECPAAEVALLIGIPEGTVRSRVRLGQARFRELAAEHPGLLASIGLGREDARHD